METYCDGFRETAIIQADFGERLPKQDAAGSGVTARGGSIVYGASLQLPGDEAQLTALIASVTC